MPKVILLVQGVVIEGEWLSGEEAELIAQRLPKLGDVIVLRQVKLLSGGLSRTLDVLCVPRSSVGALGLHGSGAGALRELEELDALRQLGWELP